MQKTRAFSQTDGLRAMAQRELLAAGVDHITPRDAGRRGIKTRRTVFADVERGDVQSNTTGKAGGLRL